MPAVSEKLCTPAAQDALLNGRLSTDKEQWKVARFEKTPPYIVVFSNDTFSSIAGTHTSPLSGSAHVHETGQHLALHVKHKARPLYEEVFDIEYLLPKLDKLPNLYANLDSHITQATSFDTCAIENWGLITGRTTALLLDSHTATGSPVENGPQSPRVTRRICPSYSIISQATMVCRNS